jgi:hypothetical protein
MGHFLQQGYHRVIDQVEDDYHQMSRVEFGMPNPGLW